MQEIPSTSDIELDSHLYYDIYNPSGFPPVMLLHGLGANSESWKLQMNALFKAGLRIITPDARGFGRSRHASPVIGFEQMAEDMAHIIAASASAPAYVVGISMGGVIGLQLALDHPELVWKLVLVNTFAALRPQRLEVWVYYLIRFILLHFFGIRRQAQAVAMRIFPYPHQDGLRQILIDQISEADPVSYRAVPRALARFNVTHRLHEIQHPTLVITGRYDTTVPIQSQQKMAELLPNARQVIIAGGGHAVSVDHPDEFNRILVNFLMSS